MGGSSTGQMTKEHGSACFNGDLSRAGGGGFASVQTRSSDGWDLSGYDGIEFAVSGDNQMYKIILKNAFGGRGLQFQKDFVASKNWQTVRVDFNSLIPSFMGRRVPGASFDSSNVRAVSFMVSFLTED